MYGRRNQRPGVIEKGKNMKITKAKDYYQKNIAKKKATPKKKVTAKSNPKPRPKSNPKPKQKIKLPIIKRVRLEGFIRKLDGKIFTVEFTKQDKTKRVMNARLSVKKYVKGTGHPSGLHTPSIKVFDMQKQAYRHINLETVTSIKSGGKKYQVN